MKIDVPWKNIKEQWKLEDFKESSPPSWEKYLEDEKEYWGEDRISGKRSHDWQWKGNEEKWIEITREKYKDYVKHCSKWFGKFSKNEIVPVIKTEKNNVIKLCIVKDEMTTWHDTIELWLFSNISLFPPKKELGCEIYTFSTTVNKAGKPTSSWPQGEHGVKIIEKENKIFIGDASFTQITPNK